MNSLQRTLAAVSFQETDRTPVFLVMLQQGARELGLDLETYFRKGRNLADGQRALIEKYEHDCVVGVPHIVEDVVPFGAGLRYYESGPPSVDRMSLARFEDIESMPVPRAADHPQMRETLEAIRLLAKRYKGEVPILGAFIAPFSLPSMLMGTKKFIALLEDDTGMRERWMPTLFAKCREYATTWANDQLEAGADIVVMADGMASADILDTARFRRYARPVIDATLADIRGIVAYEFVGRAQPLLPECRDLDVAAFLVGSDDDLEASRRMIGNKPLVGNVNNIKAVHWTRDRVYYECRRALRSMGSTGFILANQGPELPYHTPQENIRAFVEAARDAASRTERPSRAVRA